MGDDGRARAELLAAATDPSPLVPPLPALPSPRRAAVLVLFGALDRTPSTRPVGRGVSPDLDVLLLRRAATLRAHPGQVAFPGGRVDATDADAPAAALREAHEETGLDPAGVEVLGVLPSVPLEYSNHLVAPVLGWWRSPSPVRVVDDRESATVFRAPVADLLDPDRRGVTVIRRDGQEWRGPAFTVTAEHGPELVWGFTAVLLDALFDRLGWAEPWDRTRVVPLVGQR